MCIGAPKIKAPPPPAERQAMQNPKDGVSTSGLSKNRRRGMWASIFTSPQGVTGAPTVSGSVTGG